MNLLVWHRLVWAALICLTITPSLMAQGLQEDEIPAALEPWVGWVLGRHPQASCPVRYDANDTQCVWPGTLNLSVNEAGAGFAQSVRVYADTRFALPGDDKTWPIGVTVNGSQVPVVASAHGPAVELAPGEHSIAGRFEWFRAPESIALPGSVGIVRQVVDGEPVPAPVWRDGRLWLHDSRNDPVAQQPQDSLSIDVFRELNDGHPMIVTTELQLQVAGSWREIVLPDPVLAGGVPMQIQSTVPARLESDGQLRLQVRPGSWTVRVSARHPGLVAALASSAQPAPWPAVETWVWRASPQDRITEISGAASIDPRQVSLPADWAGLPAYRMLNTETLRIDTIRRGDPDPEPDQLRISRDLWLDFAGRGYTVRDAIDGRITNSWRLSADPALALGQVRLDGQAQFITRLPGDPSAGVELRRGRLNLIAESRYEGDISEPPALGWQRDFSQASAQIHLPPGWRVLSASGVDAAPGTWLAAWSLYDLFIALIVTIGVGRLWGWPWAMLAGVGLAITWHEPNAPTIEWLIALTLVALARVAPGPGRLARLITVARALALLWLIVILLPFAVQQARSGLYPQLEPVDYASAARARQDPSSLPADASLRESTVEAGNADVSAPRSTRSRSMLDKSGPAAPAYGNPSSKRALDEIDPDAVVQTGPALPQWQWRTIDLQWYGPVAATGHDLKLVMITPVQMRIIRFISIALLLGLALRLFDAGPGPGGRWQLKMLLGALFVLPAAGTHAADFPPPALLEELETRLLKQPSDAPRAAISRMHITLDRASLAIRMQVDALQETAIPLPVDAMQTQPVRVLLEGRAADNRLLRDAGQQIWMLAPPGVSSVDIAIPIEGLAQVTLPLPLRPARVTVAAPGWQTVGIDQNGVTSRQITLLREGASASDGLTGAPGRDLSPATLPPFLNVQRTLRFGLTWEVETVVTRLSPPGSAISIEVPELPGASVLTDGVAVRDGKVLIELSADQSTQTWRSRLAPVPELTLVAPPDSRWLERWRADIGTMWHLTHEGIAPIHHQDESARWLPTWHPWPDEKLVLRITRPDGVPGRTVTIDQSTLTFTPGVRATDARLVMTVRSSQGGRHRLVLPDNAALQSVQVAGRAQPIRLDGRELLMPLLPGTQQWQIDWRQDGELSWQWRSADVDYGAPHANASLEVKFPRDRWTLWVSGPSLGPAVLFWGVMIVIVIIGIGLGRAGATTLPLGTLSWILLGIGLSQVWSVALIIAALWFFTLRWRRSLAPEAGTFRFNGVQIALSGLTLLFLASLLWAVQKGLLGLPDMQVVGNQSNASILRWLLDRSDGPAPRADVWSAPMWVYRLLMLLWSLWLAWSLLDWLRWAWASLSSRGLWQPIRWRRAGRAAPAAQATAAGPTASSATIESFTGEPPPAVTDGDPAARPG